MPHSYQALVDQAQQLLKQLQADVKQSSQNDLNAEYLGKKGLFKKLSSQIKDLSAADKKRFGQDLNQLKLDLQQTLAGT